MASDLDEFLKRLGSPGRFQCFISFLLIINVFPLSFQNLNMVFLGATPPHNCKVPNGMPLNESIPTITDSKGRSQLDKCRMYKDPTNHSLGTTKCIDGWDYHYDDNEWTIVGEWDLVCDRKYLVNMVTTAYFGGTLIGAPILGMMGDKFGRKPVLLVTLYAHVLVGITQFFSSSYMMFISLKFVHGILMQGMIAAAHNMNVELFRKEHRTEAALVGNLIWTSGQFVLTFLAYFTATWRYLYLATSLPSAITIIYIWLIPESLRWLLVTNKVPEATAVAKRCARFNKVHIPNIEDDVATLAHRLSKTEGNSNGYDFRDLFRTTYIRRTTLATIFMWFSVSLAYYGINFTVPSLGGNKYVNFLISASIEMASRAILYPALKKIGRRLPNAVSFICAGILCIASVVTGNLLTSDTVDLTLISTGCALIGKAICSISFACVILLTSELFPTVIRGVALGAGGLCNRIGAMSAPQIISLGEYSSKLVPLILFGVIAIVAGIVTLALPETLHMSLPDTIEEAEQLCSKGRVSKKREKRSNSPAVEAATNSLKKRPLELSSFAAPRDSSYVSGDVVDMHVIRNRNDNVAMETEKQNGSATDSPGVANRAFEKE